MTAPIPRFQVKPLAASTDPDAWARLGLFVERDTDHPLLVATALLPPDVAAELVRQVALMNDAVDLEESPG